MERPSITIQPLSLCHRVLRGVVTTTLESIVAVLEGLVVYYYNDKKKVSTEYLSLSSFIVGVLIVFVSIAVGNLSDRSKGKYRRKTYILFFAPLYAAGTFFRFGAFSSNSSSPLYYAVSLAVQVIGRSGMSITNDAWNMELANEEVDRSKLYSTLTGMGVIGILMGLGFTAVPLVYSGTILSILIVVMNLINVFSIPEGTPMSKRCFIPTVTNISSVLWNSQYRVYLLTLSFVWFVNTVPGLLLFFLRYCLHLGEGAANSAYTMCLAAFIFTGFCALPCIPKFIASIGKIKSANIALWGLMVLGPIFFGASYTNQYIAITVFGLVGFFATMSNTLFSIIAADVVDYDELLTGMKRAASYTAVTNLPYMFVTVAGGSIPLALMSALGFEEPSDDDDNDDGDDDDGHSTVGSTAVLRVWCSLFIAVLGLCSFLSFRSYKISNEVHIQIIENIFAREPVKGLDQSEGEDATDVTGEFTTSPLTSARITVDAEHGDGRRVEDEVPVNPEPTGLDLEDSDDPVMGRKVAPPPYVTTLRASNAILSSTPLSLCEDDKTIIRLLGYYFPTSLSMCATQEGRNTILKYAAWNYGLCTVLLSLGVWQTVVAIMRGNEFGSYLIVVLSAVYSFVLAWEVLFVKGYSKIYHLNQRENSKQIQECLAKIGQKIEADKKALFSAAKRDQRTNGDSLMSNLMSEAEADADTEAEQEVLEKYVTTPQVMLRSNLLMSTLLVLSFIGAFLALNVA